MLTSSMSILFSQRPCIELLPLLCCSLLLAFSPVLGQCNLAGNYPNVGQLQDAIDAAAAANCTTITLTGTAQ